MLFKNTFIYQKQSYHTIFTKFIVWLLRPPQKSTTSHTHTRYPYVATAQFSSWSHCVRNSASHNKYTLWYMNDILKMITFNIYHVFKHMHVAQSWSVTVLQQSGLRMQLSHLSISAFTKILVGDCTLFLRYSASRTTTRSYNNLRIHRFHFP